MQKYVVSDTLADADLIWKPTTIMFDLISTERTDTGAQVCRYRRRD